MVEAVVVGALVDVVEGLVGVGVVSTVDSSFTVFLDALAALVVTS